MEYRNKLAGVEVPVTRRLASTIVAAALARGFSQPQGRRLDIQLGRASVPITDSLGRISYRFPAFHGFVDVDIGEGENLRLCCIPGGTGTMGAERQWRERTILSTPVHTVRIPGFLFGMYEVTQGQWLRVSRLPRVNRDLAIGFWPLRTPEESLWPVENSVSALQAQEFCDRLARWTGIPFRLPSEAEWEYACRAGTSTWFHFGDTWGSDSRLIEVMSEERFVPVGIKKAPNRFGLHDMHGGVGEWCADWSHPDYQGAPADGSAWMGPTGDAEFRIIRGRYDLLNMGSAGRSDFPQAGFTSILGLRVAANFTHGIVDPRPAEVSHGLSGEKDAASPGQLLTIRGTFIGPSVPVQANTDGGGRIPDLLGGVQVLVDEQAMPVLFVSSERVDCILPMGLKTGDTKRIVLRNGWQSAAPITVPILAAVPGLFVRNESGFYRAMAINENGTVNDTTAPAARGSIVSIYGSGFGELTPSKPDGSIITDELGSLPRPTQPARVQIGGRDAVVEYCGQAPGVVFGIVQINVRVPEEAASGAVSIVGIVGEKESAADVTIWIG